MCNLLFRPKLLVCVLLAALPAWLHAQNAGAPATGTQPTAEQPHTAASTAKKPAAGPFHGKLAAIDKVAKTITVGKRTFQITSETKLRKGDKPATLEDGVVGEQCSGYVKPLEGGKWLASSVNFGPKTTTKGADTKKGTAQKKDAK